MANQSWVTKFYLLGFPGLPAEYNTMVAIIMLFVYIFSLSANGIVIGLVSMKKNLHQPMYILIGILALSDLVSDTATLPKIISRYLLDDGSIVLSTCFLQMFIFHFLNVLDSVVIMLMSFDRYIAICRPLHYRVIVTSKVVFLLCFMAVIISSSVGFYTMISGVLLSYCGPNKVKNIVCAVVYVAALSCIDSLSVRQNASIVGIGVHLASLGFIVFSYTVILSKLCATVQPVNWKKVFYTCSTHLLVITLYIIPRVVVYFYNVGQPLSNPDLNILIICLYTYVPHFFSPMIFCLRTQGIKVIIVNILRNNCIYKNKTHRERVIKQAITTG